ncbi:MAG TPA: phosphatase [Actinomycetota bacterium]
MTPDQRTTLRRHLISTGIAGDTRTPRSNAVRNAEKLADGDPDKALGVGARGRDAAGILEAVAKLCGCSPTLDERDGPGFIDPDRTLDELHALGDRIEEAVRRGERMLIATGHPTGLLAMYQAVARALTAAGMTLEQPLDNVELRPPRRHRRRRLFRYLDGVAVLSTGADLLHTHESWPMEQLLDAIDPPDLVLADHGYAGAAMVRGLQTVSFTDINDPAIAVAKADGLTDVVVPLDDNVPPAWYEPIGDYLIGRVRAAAENL